jgi:hypothetical protein
MREPRRYRPTPAERAHEQRRHSDLLIRIAIILASILGSGAAVSLLLNWIRG